MNCPCDMPEFPAALRIPPGLARIARQTGTFADFRRAMLHAASLRGSAGMEQAPQWAERFREQDCHPPGAGLYKAMDALAAWRGRHPEDFGLMLLEMWAYVCDVVSFYDEVFANESYVGTAQRRASLRQLVATLGYLPTPAVAALVELAASASGRRAVQLQPGVAFRSDAFDGHPPQVFELLRPAVIHPHHNQWQLQPAAPSTFPPRQQSLDRLLCIPGSVTAQPGEILLVTAGTDLQATRLLSVRDVKGRDGRSYSEILLADPIEIPPSLPLAELLVQRPTSSVGLLTQASGSHGSLRTGRSYALLEVASPALHAGAGVVVEFPPAPTFVRLSGTRVNIVHAAVLPFQGPALASPSILVASQVTAVSSKTIEIAPAQLQDIKDSAGQVVVRVPYPAVRIPALRLDFQSDVFATLPADTSPGAIRLHSGMVPAAQPTLVQAVEWSGEGDLHVPLPIVPARDAQPPARFLIEDTHGFGIARNGSIDPSTGTLRIDRSPLAQPMDLPLRLHGNSIDASRGETVPSELLGYGDASVENQAFALKKSPLTYLPTAGVGTPSGLASTLRVYVDGIQWAETPSFFRAGPHDEVFIVRQDDQGASQVIFGDGACGRRLPTGAVVMATYRHGAGAASPPSGSITQLARPAPGLAGVRNPIPAYGGADAESSENLRRYAPRSALLLGRAISLKDLEAAAARHPGVRAANAEWRWSAEGQVPAAHVWYISDGDVTSNLRKALRALMQPDTPIFVHRAHPWPTRLGLGVTTDPRRLQQDVLIGLREALTHPVRGFLAPEVLGIGQPLFRSRLFAAVMAVPGVLGITRFDCQGMASNAHGLKPPPGHYFDFSNRLDLNGRTR